MRVIVKSVSNGPLPLIPPTVPIADLRCLRKGRLNIAVSAG